MGKIAQILRCSMQTPETSQQDLPSLAQKPRPAVTRRFGDGRSSVTVQLPIIADYALHCPRAAPTVGIVACTYHHWFEPFSRHRRFFQLPVSGRRMQRFLQFRLASHKLPIVVGRFAGGQHVARANRVCTHCGGVAVADECPALHPLRQQYASLFSTNTDTMRSFFAQQYHMRVFKFILSCLDFLQI